MMFLTVGNELPFDRLVKTVDQWCGASKQHTVFGQIGSVGEEGYKPVHFEWEEFLSPQAYQDKCAEAELIIAHAGMGSIITALEVSKPVLIMARLAALEEHRNDHQVATADRFSQRKGVFVAEDEHILIEMLDEKSCRSGNMALEQIEPYAEERLIRTIRNFILS